MELKLFLSGVPMGENLWGAQSDAAYFGTFYIPSKINTKFLIELHKNSNRIYAYYHYLVYNLINDFEGRDGSYIDVAVRLDSYCTDYLTIYNVLDIAYRKNIIGTILKPVAGGRYQYTIPDFEKTSIAIEEIEKSIRNYLGTSLTKNNFKNIPSMPTGNKNYNYFLYEVSESDVMQAVGESGKCCLSLEIDSKETLNRIDASINKGRASRQVEVNSLNVQVQNLNDKIAELNSKIENLQKSDSNLVVPYNSKSKTPDYEESFDKLNNTYFWAFLGKVLLAINIILLIGWVCLTYIHNDSNKEKGVQAEVLSNDIDNDMDNDSKVIELSTQAEKYLSAILEPIQSKDDSLVYTLDIKFDTLKSFIVVASNATVENNNGQYKVTVKDPSKVTTIVCTDSAKIHNYKKTSIPKK